MIRLFMENRINLGIDLGGSHVAVGVVSDDGKIFEQFEKDFTILEKSDLISVAMEFIVQNIDSLKRRYSFSKFGIGIPGTISDGVIVKSVNLGAENYDIKQKLEEATGMAVRVKNDAKCAAIAEYRYGACRVFRNVLFLTLGTGIGGAYVYRGELLEGSIFEGLEVGHMVIKHGGLRCKCGKFGCFEKYGSILAFKNRVIEKLGLSYDISGIELRGIIESKQHEINDIQADYISDLALGISNLVNVFEPDAIVIGGGFARYSYILLEPLKDKLLNSNLLFNERKDIIIKTAELGNDAGIIGASIM